MDKLRALIDKHPLVVFFVMTCGYSWGLWALMMASANGWLPFSFPTNWTGSFGPAFAAILVVVLSRGKAGLRALLRPLRQWRFGLRWYFFVLVECLFPFAVSFVVYALVGGSLASVSREGLMKQGGQLPLLYPIILIIGGPLGEEIGWRGYALPQLLKQRSGLAASGVIWLMWLTWHVPLFWLKGAAQQEASIVTFCVMIAVFSVLFTWVYLGTAGSLVSVLLLHTSVNTVGYTISEVSPILAKDPRLNWLFAGGFAALAVLIVLLKGPSLAGRMATAAKAETKSE